MLGPLVRRRQDERVNEVLEDDPLLGQVGVVDQLADVRPGRDELRRLLANDIVRSLGRVQFLELTLKLLAFPLEPGQSFLHQIDGIRPELRQGADEVVDLAVDCDQAVANERDFLFHLLGVCPQCVQCVSDDLFTGLRERPDSPEQSLDPVLQGDGGDTGAGTLGPRLLVDLAGALVVETGPRPTRRPLRRHVVAAGTLHQPLQGVLPAARVAGARPPFAVLVENGSDPRGLLLRNNGRVSILGADAAPDDVAEVDRVLQDSHHLLLLERSLATALFPVGASGRGADSKPVEALEYTPDGAEFFHRVVDVPSDDLGLIGVRDQLLGLLVLAVAEHEPAIPKAVLGPVVECRLRPLPDYQSFVFREADRDVVAEEVGRGLRFVAVVEELEVDFVRFEEGLEVAEVDGVPADPVHLVSQDQVEATGPNVGLEAFHLWSDEVFAGPCVDVVGNGSDRNLLQSPLLDVTFSDSLLGFERHALVRLLLGRDAAVHTDPQGTGLCSEK